MAASPINTGLMTREGYFSLLMLLYLNIHWFSQHFEGEVNKKHPIFTQF